jgi:hypothetical protein
MMLVVQKSHFRNSGMDHIDLCVFVGFVVMLSCSRHTFLGCTLFVVLTQNVVIINLYSN